MLLNLASIEENKKFVPLEIGEYEVVIKNTELKKSKKNDDMILFEFKVLNIDENRTLKDHITFGNEYALGRLKTILRLSGIDVEADIQMDFLVKSGALIGNKFTAFVDIEQYINEFNKEIVSNKIKYFVTE